jgi:hypothetical protein
MGRNTHNYEAVEPPLDTTTNAVMLEMYIWPNYFKYEVKKS